MFNKEVKPPEYANEVTFCKALCKHGSHSWQLRSYIHSKSNSNTSNLIVENVLLYRTLNLQKSVNAGNLLQCKYVAYRYSGNSRVFATVLALEVTKGADGSIWWQSREGEADDEILYYLTGISLLTFLLNASLTRSFVTTVRNAMNESVLIQSHFPKLFREVSYFCHQTSPNYSRKNGTL
jgi:hypothetical protein